MRKAEIIAAIGHAAIEATEAAPTGAGGIWQSPGFEWWGAFCAALDKQIGSRPVAGANGRFDQRETDACRWMDEQLRGTIKIAGDACPEERMKTAIGPG